MMESIADMANTTIKALMKGSTRVENSAKHPKKKAEVLVKGYWVGDIIRLDIKGLGD